jgi:hypothetical protein
MMPDPICPSHSAETLALLAFKQTTWGNNTQGESPQIDGSFSGSLHFANCHNQIVMQECMSYCSVRAMRAAQIFVVSADGLFVKPFQLGIRGFTMRIIILMSWRIVTCLTHARGGTHNHSKVPSKTKLFFQRNILACICGFYRSLKALSAVHHSVKLRGSDA